MAEPVDADKIAEAANAPASATVDGRTAAAHPIPDQIAADQYRAANEAAAETNARGGARSAWNMTRPAKAIPPGAV